MTWECTASGGTEHWKGPREAPGLAVYRRYHEADSSKRNRETHTGWPPRILPNDNATTIYNIKEHFDWNFNRKMTVKIR